MEVSLEVLLMIMYVLIILIIGLVSIILINKLINERKLTVGAIVMRFIGSELKDVNLEARRYRKKFPLLKRKQFFIDQFIEFGQISHVKEIEDKGQAYFIKSKLDQKFIRELSSRRRYTRIRAAYTLSYIRNPHTLRALEVALSREQSILVKLYLIEALSHYSSPTSIPYIIRSLFYSTDWLKSKVNVLLSSFDKHLFDCLKVNLCNERDEVEELIIHFAQHYPSSLLKNYLLKHALLTEHVENVAVRDIVVPDYFDLDDEFRFTLHSKDLNSAVHARLKSVFTATNYSELLDFIGLTIPSKLPEDLQTYVPGKADRLAFWLFKLLTANAHIIVEYFNLFAQEFKTKRQSFIIDKVNEYVTRRYYQIKLNEQRLKNAKLATKSLLGIHYQELYNNHFQKHPDIDIRTIAIAALSQQYNEENIKALIPHLYDLGTQKNAILAVSKILRNKTELTDSILDYFAAEDRPPFKLGFAQILGNRIDHFIYLLKFETGIDRENIQALLLWLISNGINNNIISFLNNNRDEELENMLTEEINQILHSEMELPAFYTQSLLDFLDKNFDDNIEKQILADVNELDEVAVENKEQLAELIIDSENLAYGQRLRSVVRKNVLKVEFASYLVEDISAKIQLAKYKPPRPKREEALEMDKLRMLRWLHMLTYLIFPIIYTFSHFDIIKSTPLLEQLAFFAAVLAFPIIYAAQYLDWFKFKKFWEYGMIFIMLMIFPILDFLKSKNWVHTTTFELQSLLFVLDFNYYVIFYVLSISGIYIVLLILSFVGLNQQVSYAKIKRNSFLFKEKMLPSISIIAPAYAEEENIIESVNSQLNLRYPNYELVVVSDGSPDNTLKVLIDYYELQKVEMDIEEKVFTQPIRGVFKNEKRYPKLTVIDKVNGGKADALNVGINVSKNEYFCGIDSDSLLEPDALLRLTAMMLNTEKESVAFGGNVLPINSCKVHKGMLESIAIPKEPLAAFQTIEYLRAFMSGRVGWAYINSLLIISGAFGLFKKDRVIDMGGYLTGKSRYKKDTVGEDMELVVRLNRYMLERKLPYAIHYCYNANCWTEVPELLKTAQIQKKNWKEYLANYISEVMYADGFLDEAQTLNWQQKLNGLFHVKERMRILVNQRDRWHRGLIDILNFHKKMTFSPTYKQIGLVSLPYFYIFEMVGPLVEFQGYVMVLFAYMLGLLNKKIALLLFIASILLGIVISLGSLMIAEKETNLYTRKEISKLILYAIAENFGPRQIANFWRIKGFFSSMQIPKGWGQMLRKAKPILVVAISNDGLREQLSTILEKFEYRVIACSDGNNALQNIKKENIKAAILDENISIVNAAGICKAIKSIAAKKDILCFLLPSSANASKELEDAAEGLSTEWFVDKDQEVLVATIASMVKQKIPV